MSSFTWGLNKNGQLGHGDYETRILPQQVAALKSKCIVDIQCGSRFTCALTSLGGVYTWGRGDDGQLGHDQVGLLTIPRLVESLEGIHIVQIASLGSHVLAVSVEGALYSWGKGDEGQLGLGDTKTMHSPQLVEALLNTPIKTVACGRMHSVALSVMEELYSWGTNEDGATGQEQVQLGLNTPKKVSGLSNVKYVACGSRHTIVSVSEEDGIDRLYGFGWNIYGQLGVGDFQSKFRPTEIFINSSRVSYASSTGSETKEIPSVHLAIQVKQIVCGFRHSLAIISMVDDADKEMLFAWGWNQYGQLGIKSGSYYCNSPSDVATLPDPIHSLAAGGRHTIAVLRRRSDNALRLYAWGKGDEGQLGTGDLVAQRIPCRVRLAGSDIDKVACGWSHSACTLVADSTIMDHDQALMVKQQLLKFDQRLPSMAFQATPSRQQQVGTRHWCNQKISEIFSYGNVDGGFAQTLNCLILFLLIVSSLKLRAGFSDSLVVGNVIPGAAATIFLSNFFYAFWGDLETKRRSIDGKPNAQLTALPHGINTVIFFAFTMLIIGPVYDRTKDAMLAYRTGLFASFTLGLLEIPCTFMVSWMRRMIPRAAMMSAIAGVSLTFISMTFAIQIFETPSLAIMPLTIILVCYGSNVALPYKIPSGLAALCLGTFLAWALRSMGFTYFSPSASPAITSEQSVFLPQTTIGMLFEAFFDPYSWQFITIIIPMLMVNIVTNLACVESAASVGDEYSVTIALGSDAILTMVGAMLGNPFPTCIYIGHPAFKAMGSKTGYNYINGSLVAILGALNGASYLIQYVPEVSGVGLLMWIGIVVTASAFERDEREEQSTKSHSAAVALGLVPALAAWCLQHMQASIQACTQLVSDDGTAKDLLAFDKVAQIIDHNGVYIYGMISLSRGYLLSSIYLASALVHIIEREFARAAVWMVVASFLSFIGAVHSFEIGPDGVSSSFGFPAKGPENYPLQYSVAYLGAAFILLLFEIHESDNSLRDWRDDILHYVSTCTVGRLLLPKSFISGQRKLPRTYSFDSYNDGIDVEVEHLGGSRNGLEEEKHSLVDRNQSRESYQSI